MDDTTRGGRHGVPLGGVMPILSTPFAADDSIDIEGFRGLVDFIIAAGAHGIVYPAIASEFQTLSCDERMRCVEACLARVAGRIPVVVGASADDPALSAELATQGCQAGASAVMVMPPRALREDAAAVRRFMERIAEAASVPLVIQNAPPPLGPELPVEVVRGLVRDLPAVAYVKEETPPCGQRISRLLEDAPANLKGVFGGAGGRYVMDELARGAAGYMPACEFTEIHVAIYAAFGNGDTERARVLYNGILPLLNLESVFRTPATKLILKKHGRLASDRCRDHNPRLDAADRRDLDAILEGIRRLKELYCLADVQ